MKEQTDVEKELVCPACGIYPVYSGDAHTCPYKEEMVGDYVTECLCCEACTRKCAEDV